MTHPPAAPPASSWQNLPLDGEGSLIPRVGSRSAPRGDEQARVRRPGDALGTRTRGTGHVRPRPALRRSPGAGEATSRCARGGFLGVRARLEAHLSSRRVSRIVYGAIVGLTLVVALDD